MYIDRADKVAEVWPIVDDLTAEHGIVTWLVVPGYRERADDTVHGDLHLAQRSIPTTLPGNRDRRPVPAKLDAVGDEAGWVDRFAAQVDAFAREHCRHEPIVRVTLVDGERFFLASLEEQPGDGFVTLCPHPEHYGDMVQGERGDMLVPRVLVVPRQSILKMELLASTPRGTRSLMGFRLPK